ncbi:MAG: aminotransferase class III-fold pyridoxal phosphate-dependent enzyme [Dehalococcoidia bacterium]|nr:aminotransferase class III-fold pyridoxal phosphate-dependent enzyme [Dehalococcoidia bacterium]
MKQPLGDTGLGATEVQDYIDRGLRHLWIHTQQQDDLARDDQFLVIESGEGIYLRDTQGRRYIDGMSGLWVVAAGHGRTELAEVVRRQTEQLAYANPFAYASAPAVDLATKLADIAPPSISKAFFVNSGSDAVETAIRMAKQWHYNRGDAKRFKVISRFGSYHGMTQGALSVNMANGLNRAPFEPLMPGSLHVPNVMCDRCPYEKTYPECDVFCARTIEDTIKAEQPETIAAIIAEPISTSNGCYAPPPEYWQTLREICDRHGILLIADEVIDAFGRTGRWFGIDHYAPVEPDFMTVAKGLTSGYAPLAAVLTSERVADGFRGGPKEAFVGGITFGAHPVACAVALANVEIIERERLVENAERTGAYLGAQLKELQSRHRVVSDTRGIGLMHTLEMKRDPETGEEFRPEDGLRERMPVLLREQGILSRAAASIAIAPPLVINREEIDELVDGLDRAIGTLESDLGLA